MGFRVYFKFVVATRERFKHKCKMIINDVTVSVVFCLVSVKNKPNIVDT